MPNKTLFFLTAINILNYLDRYLLNAVLPLIIVDLVLTNEEGGRLVAAFVFGYAVFSPFFGYLGDRCSRPKLMAIGVLAWSLATLGSGLASTFIGLLIFRACVGVGEAGFTSVVPGYIKDHVPDPIELNSKLSIFYAAIPAGAALGYVVGGYIAKYYSWKTVFFVGGLPGIGLALYLLTLSESAQRVLPKINMREGIRKILAVKTLWFAIAGYVFNGFALAGIAAFVGVYGVSIGFELHEIDTIFGGILVVTGTVGTLVGGKLAGRLSRKANSPISSMLFFSGIASAIGVPFLVLAFSVSGPTPFLLACFLGELFVFASLAPVNSVIVLAAPSGLVTLTQGITILALNLGGAFSAPLLVGAMADHVSLGLGLQLCSVALALSGFFWILGSYMAEGYTRP